MSAFSHDIAKEDKPIRPKYNLLEKFIFHLYSKISKKVMYK
ncbi:MAG: hypothetical protein ACI9QN_002681 [Arcticibacterium sp.]